MQKQAADSQGTTHLPMPPCTGVAPQTLLHPRLPPLHLSSRKGAAPIAVKGVCMPVLPAHIKRYPHAGFHAPCCHPTYAKAVQICIEMPYKASSCALSASSSAGWEFQQVAQLPFLIEFAHGCCNLTCDPDQGVTTHEQDISRLQVPQAAHAGAVHDSQVSFSLHGPICCLLNGF